MIIEAKGPFSFFAPSTKGPRETKNVSHCGHRTGNGIITAYRSFVVCGEEKRPVGRKDVGLSLCHCHTLSNLQPPLNIISSNILHGNNKVEIMLIVNYA